MSARDRLLVWIAQGAGVGRIPVAPGTFGSLLGLPWTFALAATGSLTAYLTGTVTALALSVWICGKAEWLLGRKDDPSIVLDEIAALPVAFLGWFFAWRQAAGAWPPATIMVTEFNWVFSLVVFGLFRLFDVWKPWPIRASQALWGGLGVVADDSLAALLAGILTFIAMSMLAA